MYPDSTLVITVLSTENAPLPGVRVRFHQSSGFGWSGGVLEGTTDEAGTVRFSGFPLDNESILSISVHPEGFPTLTRSLAVGEYLQTGGHVTIPLRYNLVFPGILTHMGADTGQALVLEYFFPPGPDDPFRTDRVIELARSVPVGADGSFEINGPRDGMVSVRVRRGNEILYLGNVRVINGSPVPVEIQVPDPTQVQIRVKSSDQATLSGAHVVILRKDPGFADVRVEGVTSGGGTLSFYGCAPGQYDGAVTAEGYDETGFDFKLDQVEPTRIIQVVIPKSTE
jgi:hypothetical protein